MSGVVIAETLRRHLRNVVYVVFVVMIAIGAGFLGGAGGPMSWVEFCKLGTILLGCQLIGPEFSSGTLQLILAKPINRTTYLLSRFAGVVMAIWIVFAVPFAIDAICRVTWARGPIEWRDQGVYVVHVMVSVLLTCALLTLFSTFLRAYFNIGLYFALEALLAVTLGFINTIMRSTSGRMASTREFFLEHPLIGRSLRAATRNLYPDAPGGDFDRDWIIMVVTNAVIALLLAALIFRKREVPYGAD